MISKNIKKYLLKLNINSINQLEENDLDYWHQKKFIELQRSSIEKELISKQLIELNNAKEYIDEIDYETLKKQFTISQNDNNSKRRNFSENLDDFDEDFDEELDEISDENFDNNENQDSPSSNKVLETIGSIIGGIIIIPLIIMFYFGVNIGLNKLTDLPGDLVGEFIENRKKKKNQSIKTEIFNNGDKYIGELKDGYQNGQGTNFYANGDEYNGEFLNGKRHGQEFING